MKPVMPSTLIPLNVHYYRVAPPTPTVSTTPGVELQIVSARVKTVFCYVMPCKAYGLDAETGY